MQVTIFMLLYGVTSGATLSMIIRTASLLLGATYGGIWKENAQPAFARSQKHSYVGGCSGRRAGHRAIYSRRCARIHSAWSAGWQQAHQYARQVGRGKRSNGSRIMFSAEYVWAAFGSFWTLPYTTGSAIVSIGMGMLEREA
jgi:hypothetical protein